MRANLFYLNMPVEPFTSFEKDGLPHNKSNEKGKVRYTNIFKSFGFLKNLSQLQDSQRKFIVRITLGA